MSSEKKKLVMFDFDGVLINTQHFWYKLHLSVNEGLTWEKFSDMSNGNFIEKQKELLENKEYNWPKNYEESFDHALHHEFTVQDILHDAILYLSDHYQMAIVSSASNKILNKFLKKENLDTCFDDILGYEDHSSKVIKINGLLEKYNIEKKDAVIITDTLGDVREANEAGVYSIGVLWGLHTEDILKQGNPVKIIANPNELLVAIQDVLK